jgi:ribosomal-protein-alanine N-acetyltransferase
MPGQPEVRGDRVLLRPWRATDVGFVLSVSTDPLIPLISQVPDRPDAAGALAFVDAQRVRFESGRGWAWAVVPPGQDEVVGYVGALWVAQSAARASIGYWTGPAARRSGVTADAVRAASEWLLAEGGVARLEAYIEPPDEVFRADRRSPPGRLPLRPDRAGDHLTGEVCGQAVRRSGRTGAGGAT